MYSSSRGILYTSPPTADDGDRKRTREDDTATPEPDDAESTTDDATTAVDGAVDAEPDVEDVSPTASRADWTGNVPADD